MSIAAIGLGANVDSPAGSPEQTIRSALARLNTLGQLRAVSSLYLTEPVGFLHQPPFVNGAALLQTELGPLPLLEALLATERAFGRDRANAAPKGPRTLDLDLLLYDDLVLDEPALTLPHPAMHERRFVLAPLAEIAPTWAHPRLGCTVGDLLAALPEDASGVRLLATL